MGVGDGVGVVVGGTRGPKFRLVIKVGLGGGLGLNVEVGSMLVGTSRVGEGWKVEVKSMLVGFSKVGSAGVGMDVIVNVGIDLGGAVDVMVNVGIGLAGQIFWVTVITLIGVIVDSLVEVASGEMVIVVLNVGLSWLRGSLLNRNDLKLASRCRGGSRVLNGDDLNPGRRERSNRDVAKTAKSERWDIDVTGTHLGDDRRVLSLLLPVGARLLGLPSNIKADRAPWVSLASFDVANDGDGTSGGEGGNGH